ncbi:peptidogalycan biosysnthesis protein [Streptomyces sp. CB03238]|uniref:peptidogalycan biosysnthesis protein n=1 Tax=Streptomyces sp. CB03238 TaxID=1907777 RepID=UPI000A1003B9|nr:peptidogalycan biosysnthesis protein [Streptomyces sp. CB03238]
MNISDENGIRIVHAGIDEALGRDWRKEQPDVDLVRVKDPDITAWQPLREAGFTVKPGWITWLAPACASEEDFLMRMSRRSQRGARSSAAALAERGVTLASRSPLDPTQMDEFLTVYEAHVATLRNGVPFARRFRERLLDRPEDYFMVRAEDADGDLVGACLCEIDATMSIVRVRFTALGTGERDGNLARSLYLTAFQETRERGHRWISLGSDPSTYGHLVQPGLFVFKSRFGLFPVPLKLLQPNAHPVQAADEADLVLRLIALSDPSLHIAYHGDAPTSHATDAAWLREDAQQDPEPAISLHLEVLSRDAEIDTNAYRAGFLRRTTLRVIDA